MTLPARETGRITALLDPEDPCWATGSSVENAALSYLKTQYKLAKQRARNHVKHGRGESKLYSAVVTILYSTLCAARTRELEQFIRKVCSEFSMEGYDESYWKGVLDVAGEVRRSLVQTEVERQTNTAVTPPPHGQDVVDYALLLKEKEVELSELQREHLDIVTALQEDFDALQTHMRSCLDEIQLRDQQELLAAMDSKDSECRLKLTRQDREHREKKIICDLGRVCSSVAEGAIDKSIHSLNRILHEKIFHDLQSDIEIHRVLLQDSSRKVSILTILNEGFRKQVSDLETQVDNGQQRCLQLARELEAATNRFEQLRESFKERSDSVRGLKEQNGAFIESCSTCEDRQLRTTQRLCGCEGQRDQLECSLNHERAQGFALRSQLEECKEVQEKETVLANTEHIGCKDSHPSRTEVLCEKFFNSYENNAGHRHLVKQLSSHLVMGIIQDGQRRMMSFSHVSAKRTKTDVTEDNKLKVRILALQNVVEALKRENSVLTDELRRSHQRVIDLERSPGPDLIAATISHVDSLVGNMSKDCKHSQQKNVLGLSNPMSAGKTIFLNPSKKVAASG